MLPKPNLPRQLLSSLRPLHSRVNSSLLPPVQVCSGQVQRSSRNADIDVGHNVHNASAPCTLIGQYRCRCRKMCTMCTGQWTLDMLSSCRCWCRCRWMAMWCLPPSTSRTSPAVHSFSLTDVSSAFSSTGTILQVFFL